MKSNNQIKINILLIEDNPDHADLIIRSISKTIPRASFKHCPKQNECLSWIEKKKYDLVLMDFYLSGSSSLSLLQKIKESYPNLPVIIITGQGDEKTAAKSIKAGAEEYVEKTRDSLENLPKIIFKILEQNKINSKTRNSKKTKSSSHIKGVFEEFENISSSLRSLYKRLNGKPKSRKSKKGELRKIPLLEKKVSGLKSIMMKLFSSE